MKNWLTKLSSSDYVRLKNNIVRLEYLRTKIHHLANFVFSFNSGAFNYLEQLLKEKLVLGRPKIYSILSSALYGENNQKIALDSPGRFSEIMRNAELVVDREINQAKKDLKELGFGETEGN